MNLFSTVIVRGSNLISWLFLTAALISPLAHADTLKGEKELRKLAESVMTKVGVSDLQSAFKVMQPFVVIPESEFQSLVLSSKAQRDQFGARYGRTVGAEFISEEKIGESLVRIIYIEKTEKHALPWAFYFYKTPNGWVLNSFSWNDQMTALFTHK